MKVAAIWQGVTMMSGDVAKIPLEIYRRLDGSDREVDSSHASYEAVRYQANPDQSAYEFRRQMMVHVLIWGNAYAYLERDGAGNVVGMYPLLPDRTTCRKIDGRLVYQSEVGCKLEYFDCHDVWHLKGVSFDGINGLDPVAYARHAIGKILAREDFASQFFNNGGRVGGILQLPWAKDKTKTDRKEEGFRKAYESKDAAFKTVILRGNAKFHAAQSSFADTQMVELEQSDVKVAARILNMPPHKLGAEGNSSYNSLEQENQAYYDNCLSHWFIGIESQCRQKMFSRETRSEGMLFFEHTIGALLWADSKTVANIGSNAIRSGWLKPNDVRRWFNFNATPDGDQLYVPSGMVAAGSLPAEPDDSNDPDDDSDSDEMQDAVRQLIDETTARFHKRLAVRTSKVVAKRSPDEIKDWIETGILDDQRDAGRRMFAAAQRIIDSLVNEEERISESELLKFRHRLQLAWSESQSRSSLEAICGEYK